MEDLPLGRIAALVPEFAVKDLPFGQNTDDITIYLVLQYAIMDGSPGDISEEPVMQEKGKKGWRISCDVGEATEGLENEL